MTKPQANGNLSIQMLPMMVATCALMLERQTKPALQVRQLFAELTTHSSGISVTGGSIDEATTGVYKSGNDVFLRAGNASGSGVLGFRHQVLRLLAAHLIETSLWVSMGVQIVLMASAKGVFAQT